MYDIDIFLVAHGVIAASFIISVFPFLSAKIKFRSQLLSHFLLASFYLFLSTDFLKPLVTGDYNLLHRFLQSFVASVHVGLCSLLWKTRTFGRPEQSIIFANIIGSFISLLTRLFAAWHMSEKSTRSLTLSDNYLVCVICTDGIWFVTEIIRLVLNRRTTQEEIDGMVKRTTLWVEGKGTFYAENAFYFDAGLTLTYAIIHFAFPQHVLRLIIKPEHKLDAHHYLWCRLFGALNLIPAVSSLSARFFPPELQTAYLVSRLVTQLTVFLLNIYGHWVIGIYSANHITGFMISGFFSSFLFSAYHRTYDNYFVEYIYEDKEPDAEETKKTE